MARVNWTVVAPIISRDGANVASYFSTDPADMWNPVRHRTWVVDPNEVRHQQNAPIPLRLAHRTPPVGEITHLERRAADESIWCVGTIDADIRPDPNIDYFLSVEARYEERTGRDVEITGGAIVAKSAMTGLSPITWLGSNGLNHRGQAKWRFPFHRDLINRADTARRARRFGAPILVADEPTELERRDPDTLSADERYMLRADQADRWLSQPLRYRPSKITNVR